MKSKTFKCTLKSDIVLNSALATQGNLESLDYITGSNFLGLLAQNYSEFGNDAFDVFHSGKVIFGNAYIADGNSPTYPVPFDIIRPKGNNDYSITKLHHATNYSNIENRGIQYKQERSGYITLEGKIIKSVKKTFALKSAYDANKRRSEDEKMFGYESIQSGQHFIFSVHTDLDSILNKIASKLVGLKQMGKSKTAEYGLVEIKEISDVELLPSFQNNGNYTIVYAASHLCFYGANGQPTFQPSSTDIGLTGGKINWNLSSIRTFQYTSWNRKRDNPGIQRHCIAKGSVFYVEGATKSGYQYVGEYNFDGLGHIIYNPAFLESEGEKAKKVVIANRNQNMIDGGEKDKEVRPIRTKLALYLNELKSKSELELHIANEVQKSLHHVHSSLLAVSKSQWGKVRSLSANAKSDDEMRNKLTSELTQGVAARRYWLKDDEKAKNNLDAIIKKQSRAFVIKFASEIAKKIERIENQKSKRNAK